MKYTNVFGLVLAVALLAAPLSYAAEEGAYDGTGGTPDSSVDTDVESGTGTSANGTTLPDRPEIQPATVAPIGTEVVSPPTTGAGSPPALYFDQDDDGDAVPTILEDDELKSAIYIKLSDVPTEDQFEILIDSKKVQGWNLKNQDKVRTIAPQSPKEVNDVEELALFVAAQISDDPQMEEVSLNYQKIEMEYRSDAKLFGFISSSLVQEVSLENGVVSLENPWYSFLFSDVLTLNDIEAGTEEKKKKEPSRPYLGSLSFGSSNSGKVGVTPGEGTPRTVADIAGEVSALSEVMKAGYDLAKAKKI
ncbi:MAG: hypothetical protein WBK28_01020 [Minisyncoccia bacterium]